MLFPPKTIVKLQGGLGNQMFQYAAGRSIRKKNRVFFDTSFLYRHAKTTSNFTARNFELSIFDKLKAKSINKYMMMLLVRILRKQGIYGLLRSLLFPGFKIIQQTKQLEYIDFSIVTDSNTSVYLDGYFQNENYFIEIRDELLDEFKFPPVSGKYKSILDEILINNAVSIHVRRGDYLRPEIQKAHGVLSIDYYKKAIGEINKYVHNPHYYIFSDDIEWCKSNFDFLKDVSTIVSCDGGQGWEDMYLMTKCKHNIVANSSYSWWGAWLNTNSDKKVIAAKQWFVVVNPDIVPLKWIKI